MISPVYAIIVSVSPLSLGPSVKAPLRSRSLWSPYLLTVSLLLMILKPLFSLKRVCPVTVRREQYIV